MKLEYFGVHGRGVSLRMALTYCNVEFEDEKLTFEAFGAKKAAGAYPMGQVPVLHLDDGKILN